MLFAIWTLEGATTGKDAFLPIFSTAVNSSNQILYSNGHSLDKNPTGSINILKVK